MGNLNSIEKYGDDDEDKTNKWSTSTIALIVLGTLLVIAIIIIIILIAICLTKAECPACPTESELCYIGNTDIETLGQAQSHVKDMGSRAQTFMGAAACSPLSCPGAK